MNQHSSEFNVQGDPIRLRTERELLASIAGVLELLLAEARHQNSADRTGAVSSICFEDRTKGEPACTTKHYAGSPLTREDVDAALDIHAYAHREAARRAMDGWQETVDAVTKAKTTGEPWRELVKVPPA